MEHLLRKHVPCLCCTLTLFTFHFPWRQGYLPIVKLLINHGAQIDVVNNHGYSALLWASENQHPYVAEYLLDQGAKVNYVIKDGDYAGYSALTFAYKRGQDYFIKKLEEKGANVSSETIFGYCASHNRPTHIKCNPRYTSLGE